MAKEIEQVKREIEPIQGDLLGLSKSEILLDLARMFKPFQGANCLFRASDAYQAYSAKINVELTLIDIDSQTVSESIEIGVSTAEEVRARNGWEAPDLSRPIGL